MLLLIAAGVPALVFGLLAGFFFIRAKNASDELIFITQTMAEREKSIAVLPFENLSLSGEDAFLADGLHNEITSVLSRVKELKTIARNSTLSYRGALKSSQDIGDELGMANLLTGAVQRMGNNIRVNVELIDAYNDIQIWADSYLREYSTESLFEIQSEICTSIGIQLSTILTPEENDNITRVPTQNVKALEAYFKGREIVELRNQSQWEEAIVQFNQAIALDPEFTLAYVGLGKAYLVDTSHAMRTPALRRKNLAEAEKAASQALDLDDNLASVHTLRGDIARGRLELDSASEAYELALGAYERALEINPNDAEAHYGLARLAIDVSGYFDSMAMQAAFDELNKAIELDPNNHLFRRELGRLYRKQGEVENAQGERRAAIQLRPDYEHGYRELGEFTANSLCRYDEAIVYFRKAVALDPSRFTNHFRLFELYRLLGDEEEAIRWAKVTRITGQSVWSEPLQTIIDLIRIEDSELWEATAREVIKDQFEWGIRRQLLNADLRAGRRDVALARYKTLFPFLFEEAIEDFERNREGGLQAQYAIELAEILLLNGNTERATYLTDLAWKLYEPLPRMGWHTNLNFGSGFGIVDVLILALKGEKAKALKKFQEAIDAGFLDRGQLEFSALDSLRDDPLFIALEKRVKDDLAQQLANVRRKQSNGELEAIPEQVRQWMRQE